MSDPASVLISTAALLAVAVMAGAVGSLRADVQELRRRSPDLDTIRAEYAKEAAALRAERERDLAAAQAERAKDRAHVLTLRLVVRRLQRIVGMPAPPEDPEPDPIGFRPPP